MAYRVDIDPRTGRFIVSDPNRGEFPALFHKQLVANDFAALMTWISEQSKEDQREAMEREST